MQELAARCKVSDATALRFSRSPGYRGWLELKVALIRSLPEVGDENMPSGTQNTGAALLFSGIIEKSKLALEETLLAFDEKVFLAVIKSVIEAERILIAGSGTSGPIAQHAIVQALSFALSEEMGDIARINEDKIWDAFFPNSSDKQEVIRLILMLQN